MNPVPKQALVDAVNKIVRPKARKGLLHTLSHRIVRNEVEKLLGLEEGMVSTPEYKAIIKEATETAMNETPSEEEREDEITASKQASDGTNSSKALANSLFSTPASGSSKRKRSPSLTSEPEPPAPKPAAKAYKEVPKRAFVDLEAGDDGNSGDDNEEPSEDESGPRKRLSKGKGKQPAPRKSKSRAAESDSDVVMDDSCSYHSDSDVERPSKPSTKADSSTSKSNGKSKDGSNGKRKSAKATNMQYKTPEHVPTSDMEQDEPTDAPSANIGRSGTSKPKKPSPKKRRQSASSDAEPVKQKKSKTITSDEESERDSGDETETKTKKHSSPKKSSPPESKQKRKKPEVDGDDSETGLSDLIDEPPKRKKVSKSTEKAAVKPKKSTSKRSASKASLSKDEETIKRLKSLVLACGVRKVWAKLFKDMSERQQISKLKEMLADLGMTGRLSLEKAKEIKAKREFEKELEDVQEFAKSMQERESRRSKAARGKKEESVEQESSSEEEEEVAPRRRRSGNARSSIAAFLQEQSDSEG